MRLFCGLVVAALLVIVPAEAVAQMFGQRTMGRPLSRRQQLGTRQQADAVGQVQGTERFIRGNRSARDFVGADTRDVTAFVGQQGAAVQGPVVSAVRDLRARREVNVNRTLRSPRVNQMYNPRLRVNFEYAVPSNQDLSERLQTHLQLTETLQWLSPIEVLVADGTATLRGKVASARDREMAALLVRLEPGISAVQNELEVVSPPPPAAAPAVSPVGRQPSP